jgi:hypothetical protein
MVPNLVDGKARSDGDAVSGEAQIDRPLKNDPQPGRAFKLTSLIAKSAAGKKIVEFLEANDIESVVANHTGDTSQVAPAVHPEAVPNIVSCDTHDSPCLAV